MMNKKVIAVALALALAGGSYAQDDTAKKKGKPPIKYPYKKESL